MALSPGVEGSATVVVGPTFFRPGVTVTHEQHPHSATMMPAEEHGRVGLGVATVGTARATTLG